MRNTSSYWHFFFIVGTSLSVLIFERFICFPLQNNLYSDTNCQYCKRSYPINQDASVPRCRLYHIEVGVIFVIKIEKNPMSDKYANEGSHNDVYCLIDFLFHSLTLLLFVYFHCTSGRECCARLQLESVSFLRKYQSCFASQTLVYLSFVLAEFGLCKKGSVVVRLLREGTVLLCTKTNLVLHSPKV